VSIRITDYGMDAVASTNPVTTSSAIPSFENWHMYTAVGTGTSAPATSDTGLDAEVARTNSNGGFSMQESKEFDSVANVIRYTSTTYRVFNFTSAYNLTEYGHFTSSSGANAVFRDLFRQDPNDPNSQAVVISVQDGDQLQIIKIFVLEVDWSDIAKTVTFTVPDGTDLSFPGTQGFGGTDTTYLDRFLRSLWPGDGERRYICLLAGTQPTDRTQAVNATGAACVTANSLPYTAGSYTRRFTGTFGTSSANATWSGLAFTGMYLLDNIAFRFVFDTADSFTKEDTHTLELYLDVSWSRG